MTEAEARDTVASLVSANALAAIEGFVAKVIAESERQNLIAKTSLAMIWQRHVLDSAQLLALATDAIDGLWIDVGTGAGFPGMIVALASERECLLVEPRRMRAEFLAAAYASSRVRILQTKIERVSAESAAIISARAVAPAPELFHVTSHLASGDTLYLLPKGQSATTECVEAQRTFSGMFHVEQSMTDVRSGIIVARNVRAKR